MKELAGELEGASRSPTPTPPVLQPEVCTLRKSFQKTGIYSSIMVNQHWKPFLGRTGIRGAASGTGGGAAGAGGGGCTGGGGGRGGD